MLKNLFHRVRLEIKNTLKKLSLFFYIWLFFSLVHCGSTVEFIPEPDFRLEYTEYQKRNFHEVEITYKKPKFPFTNCGKILIRDFQGEKDWKNLEEEFKKEAFERKLDGVWILNLQKEEIPPLLIFGKNQSGMIVNYQEIGKEVAKIQALGFRYKKNANPK